MPFVRKCAHCGADLPSTLFAACPVCGTKVAAPTAGRIWVGALVQFALAAAFMLAFHFPKFMIVIFGVVIFLGTLLSIVLKAKPGSARTPAQQPSRPTLYRIYTLGIAVGSFVFLCFMLLGFVMVMNSWSQWQTYEGLPFRPADFQVSRVYFQKHSRGGPDVYASGIVEGNREWMSLYTYLRTLPHSQEELEARVPVGTSIHIYLFPNLKGRGRVRLFEETPPAESYRQAAMKALKYSLGGLALSGLLIFALVFLRKSCFEDDALPQSSEQNFSNYSPVPNSAESPVQR